MRNLLTTGRAGWGAVLKLTPKVLVGVRSELRHAFINIFPLINWDLLLTPFCYYVNKSDLSSSTHFLVGACEGGFARIIKVNSLSSPIIYNPLCWGDVPLHIFSLVPFIIRIIYNKKFCLSCFILSFLQYYQLERCLRRNSPPFINVRRTRCKKFKVVRNIYRSKRRIHIENACFAKKIIIRNFSSLPYTIYAGIE